MDAYPLDCNLRAQPPEQPLQLLDLLSFLQHPELDIFVYQQLSRIGRESSALSAVILYYLRGPLACRLSCRASDFDHVAGPVDRAMGLNPSFLILSPSLLSASSRVVIDSRQVLCTA